ncbi:MAG: glycosyltransferase [Calditrichota bacterium]
MKASEVSVIVPTFNALEHLKQTIASLERQEPNPSKFQVIVVDDGSTDSLSGTKAWLNDYHGVLNLKILVNEKNQGRAATRNRGAQAAERPLLLFIDGDVECSPRLVAGHAARHDGSDRAVVGRVTYDRRLGRRAFQRYLETRGAVKLKPGEPVPGRYFLSGNASLPRNLFLRLGGFDEGFPVYGEDLDFGLQLVKAGTTLTYDPSLIVRHLHLRTLEATLELSRHYGAASLPRLLEKHPELFRQLKLDWAEDDSGLGWLKRLILADPMFNLVKFFTKILDNIILPTKFYDYLLFRSYYQGWRKSQRLN